MLTAVHATCMHACMHAHTPAAAAAAAAAACMRAIFYHRPQGQIDDHDEPASAEDHEPDALPIEDHAADGHGDTRDEQRAGLSQTTCKKYMHAFMFATCRSL